MDLTRRSLLLALAATAAFPLPASAADVRPCHPPRYLPWVGRREHRLASEIGDAGFVNYYGEPFSYDQAINVPRDSLPTCSVFGAESSTLDNPGRVRNHLADMMVRGKAASTDCHTWPLQNVQDFETKVAALLAQMKAAAPSPTVKGNTRLCAVGSHHSSSDVYKRIDGGVATVVRVDGLNHVIVDRREWRASHVDAHPSSAYALVGAGITVCHLNETLWEFGLALETQGSFDGQSLAGAISTGTHGAGANHGAIADSIEAVVLVTCVRDPDSGNPRWEVLQIEPTEGITDPASFQTERAGAPWRLVQDTALFDAVIVCMGTMGVIVGYVMRVRSAYFLYELRVGRPWSEVRSNLVERAMVPPNGFTGEGWRYELVVNPSSIAEHDDWVCTEVYRDAWTYDLDYLSKTRDIPQKWAGGITRGVNLGGNLGYLVANLANAGLVKGKRVGTFADRCYRVLKLGQGEFVQAWGCEMMVRAEHGVDLVEWLLAQNPKFGELGFGNRRDARILNPFGVRFATGRRGFLSQVHWRTNGEPGLVCTLEISEPVKDHDVRNRGVRANGKPSGKRIVETWAEAFCKRFGADGRLHWGQVQGNTGPTELLAGYPPEDVSRWVDAFRTLNPYGLFDTAFAKRAGFVERRDAAPGGVRYAGL